MSQKRILLVDDESSIRLILGAMLQQAGYAVDLAENGFAALHNIQQTAPDLVVTDLRMSGMSGFELLAVIRTRFPQLPRIALSGEFLSLDVPQGTLADAFFQKGNYEFSDFLVKISELLASPYERKPAAQARPSVWTPTRDGQLMLTCTKCLRSFPIEACEGSAPPKETNCIFCDTRPQIQVVAVGMMASAD